MNDRCERCDRPRAKWDDCDDMVQAACYRDVLLSSTIFDPAGDCDLHRVDWRARCLAAEAERDLFRKMLWHRHGADHMLYGDDGEMQCSTCFLDFKRMTAQEIYDAWTRMAIAEIVKAAEARLRGSDE